MGRTSPAVPEADVITPDEDLIADKVWDEAKTAHTGANTYGKLVADIETRASEARLAELDAANLPADIDTLKTRIPGVVQPQTGDSYARLGAPAGASVSADIAAVKTETAAIKAKTDNLPAAPAAQAKLDTLHDTRIPDVLSLANINAEVDTALNTAIPASNTADSVNDILLDQLKPRLPVSGTIAIAGDQMALTAAARGAVVDETWDEATAGHTTAGTFGKLLTDYLTGDSFARLGAPAGASIAADIATNLTNIQQLQTRLGQTSDSAVDAAGNTGSLHAKVRDIGTDLDTLKTDVAAIKTQTDKVWTGEAVSVGQTSLADNTETTVYDVGADAGAPRYRFESALLYVVRQSHATVTLKLYAEINGTLRQVGSSISVSDATKVVALTDFGAGVALASRHLRVTATGSEAAPGTPGTVDRTIQVSKVS